MTASVTEQILVRAAAVLASMAGVTVERFTGRRLSAGDLPAIVVRRAATQSDSASFENVQTATLFDLDIFTAAGADTETAADALHMAAHALLIADADLAAWGRATLRCAGTESDTDEMDCEYTRLTAHYQIDAWSAADLSTFD